MQRYKSPQELPFNITPAAKEGWKAFKRRQPLQDKGLEM